MPRAEYLRNGHAVAKCGVATLEYLLDYAKRNGVRVGAPTKGGRYSNGQYASIVMADGELHRADYVDDIKPQPKLRRLRPKRFCKVVDALVRRRAAEAGELPAPAPSALEPVAPQLALFEEHA